MPAVPRTRLREFLPAPFFPWSVPMVVVTFSFSLFMNGRPVSPGTLPAFLRSMRTDLLFFCLLSVVGIGCSLGRVSLFGGRRDSDPSG